MAAREDSPEQRGGGVFFGCTERHLVCFLETALACTYFGKKRGSLVCFLYFVYLIGGRRVLYFCWFGIEGGGLVPSCYFSLLLAGTVLIAARPAQFNSYFFCFFVFSSLCFSVCSYSVHF